MKKLLVVLVLLASAIQAAFGISFTFVNSTGVTVGAVTPIGSNGVAFSIPTYFLVGAGVKSATITYNVQADAGFYLDSVDLDPNGTVQGAGVASVSAVHGSNTATFSDTSEPLKQLGNSVTALTDLASSYTVTLNLDLTNPRADSISKISVMQVFYSQQPVPEPGTMIALGAGLALFARKFRKGKVS